MKRYFQYCIGHNGRGIVPDPSSTLHFGYSKRVHIQYNIISKEKFDAPNRDIL